MKDYFQFINESEMAFSDFDITKIKPEKDVDLEYLALKELGKDGKLNLYVDTDEYVLKFGMLKALYQDAIEYKKKREFTKGWAKFALRAIPLALAPIWFPVWLISQILGASRAVNKIIIPALMVKNTNYNIFLINMITNTMNIVEGDIRPLLGKDWYYDVFYVHDGLTKMVRKEYHYEFATFIADKIEKMPDGGEVPKYWLDGEFRKWLNNKFQIDLPIGKVMIRHKEN